MTIQELAALIEGEVQTKTVDTGREVTCGYTCDLLSWVMAKGREGMAWATVQAHMNAVAVAVPQTGSPSPGRSWKSRVRWRR